MKADLGCVQTSTQSCANGTPEKLLDRQGDPANTAMCWDFQCGDGWFTLLDDLCVEISRQVSAGTIPPVVATQVKEKSGYIRFRIRDGLNHEALSPLFPDTIQKFIYRTTQSKECIVIQK